MGTASQPDDLRPNGDLADAAAGGIESGVHTASLLGVSVPGPPAVPLEGAAFRASYVASAEGRPSLSAARPSLPKPAFPIKPVPVVALESESGRVSFTSLAPSIARFARFELLGRLAVGGMAEIFLARENVADELTRNVVVKVLRKSARGKQNEGHFEQLFLREGRVAAQLMHPNICHVYEFGRHSGHYFIAMEYVEGVSLRDLLGRVSASRLDPYLAAWLVGQVASALHYAHTARDSRRRPLGVVHRDVSPQNIMVRDDGIVKLLDFGVAHVAAADEAERAGMLFGKLAYMAPEQCRGVGTMDGRADVFALGVCLYEALTGRRLYRRKDDAETIKALLEEPPPSIRAVDPSLPEALSKIVERALAKKPEQRFASAGAFQEALDRFIAKSGRAVGASDAARLMARNFSEQLASGPRLTTNLDLTAMTRPEPVLVPDTSSLAPAPISDSPIPTRSLPLGTALLLAMAAALLAWIASRSVDVPRAQKPRTRERQVQAANVPEPAVIKDIAQVVPAAPEPEVVEPSAAPAEATNTDLTVQGNPSAIGVFLLG